VTREGKAREWWIWTSGWRWGRKTSGECAPTDAVVARSTRWISGETLKWGPSLREVTAVRTEPGAPAPNTARWTYEPRGGSCQTSEALGRGDVSGRQVNHRRGARGCSDAPRGLEILLTL